MKFSREFYIPKGSVKVADKKSSAVVYLYERDNVPFAVAFHGRAQKPDWKFRFRDTEHRAKRVSMHFQNIQTAEVRRRERKQISQKARALNVGDILRASWGYDQTNIDYFQVTALVGEQFVEIRPIASQNVEDTGWMQGKCVPVRDKFTGEPMRRRVSYGDLVKVDNVRRASPWSGTPDHWTSYA